MKFMQGSKIMQVNPIAAILVDMKIIVIESKFKMSCR